jgi:DNA mismatch endonuclease, patch repair protein
LSEATKSSILLSKYYPYETFKNLLDSYYFKNPSYTMDHLTEEKRSWNMSRIRSTNSKAELLLRSLLHRKGYRFRLHVKDLPGKPDIVLSKHKAVIFIHGCFWHQHENCPYATMPKSHTDFWSQKLLGNKRRDKNNQRELQALGWRVLEIWECAIIRNRDLLELEDKIRDWLVSIETYREI